MKMQAVVTWVEAHPIEATVIGAGGAIGLLWLLGFFGSSSSSTDPLAAAYYSAEAQQAVVGGQIQIANIQANSATAIAQAQDTAATNIATISANDALASTQANADAAKAIIENNNRAALMQTILGQTLPQEAALSGGAGQLATPLGNFTIWRGQPAPNYLESVGFTPEQADKLIGVA